MASLVLDCFSDALEVGVSVTVVLPQPTRSQIGVDDGADDEAPQAAADAPPPVLYLLHGLSDDHTAWTRYTAIERYATARGLAVVMPAVNRSFYTDEAHGHRYWTYVSEELPTLVHRFLRISDAPEDTFVAGLSMGGYGALRLALTHPDRYAAAASLSGALDVRRLVTRPDRSEMLDRVWGGSIPDAGDVFALLDTAAEGPAALPRLHVSCGTEDVLIDAGRRFADRARAAGADVTTDWRPGEHEWGLWDDVIRDVIAWLPLRGDATSASA